MESNKLLQSNLLTDNIMITTIQGLWNYLMVDHYRNTGKRCWDFASAIIIFIFLLPLFICISILIAIDSRGPVIFKQKRVGKDGKIFHVYKFRTMINNSHLHNPKTEENDFRITRIGKLLRPLSIDELPQLINIIKGDMSFIGPRPLSEEEMEYIRIQENYPESFVQKLVPKVRPGILGWAIFQGREKISYQNRFKYNKEYEDKCSLIFDSYISYLTLKKYWLSYLIVIALFITVPTIIIYSIDSTELTYLIGQY